MKKILYIDMDIDNLLVGCRSGMVACDPAHKRLVLSRNKHLNRATT